MSTIKTKDETEIHYKDWGNGQPVVFSHGWPLSADAWDPQMLFLGQKGYRVQILLDVSLDDSAMQIASSYEQLRTNTHPGRRHLLRSILDSIPSANAVKCCLSRRQRLPLGRTRRLRYCSEP
jgi:pimeloyl-ACP methyl ester carboxylesterase